MSSISNITKSSKRKTAEPFNNMSRIKDWNPNFNILSEAQVRIMIKTYGYRDGPGRIYFDTMKWCNVTIRKIHMVMERSM